LSLDSVLIMYGFNHLPPINSAIQVNEWFGTAALQWFPYVIPYNATFLQVLLIGPGGSGGTPTVGVGASGAGGGGSGAITKALIPTFLLPSVIYVSANNAAGGNVSCIALKPALTIDPLDVIVSARQGGGGANGGSGGSAASGMPTSDARWCGSLALWNSQGGVAGGAGATGTASNINPLSALPLLGGAGGGGSSGGGGGSVNAVGLFVGVPGGASGAENPGSDGYLYRQPLGAVGGSGGTGRNAAGTGLAKGGNGAIGCGGGGGGNYTSGTSGAGGNGGPGYAMIIAF
jgi:hypothetical protein